MDGPGIESQWGKYFPHLSRPALAPKQLSVKWVTLLLPGSKATGARHLSLNLN